MTDKLSRYKQQVLNDFNNRRSYETEFHKQAAHRLVELAQLQPGQTVLDVATGTGLAAIAAARAVGPSGSILGTDFSSRMLLQAREKAAALQLDHVSFEMTDADHQTVPAEQFDAILCSCAIAYFRDIPAILRRWHHGLKPGGTLAFSCLTEASPSASALFRDVVAQQGHIVENPNALLGTPTNCQQQLSFGFTGTSIVSKQFGFYVQDGETIWNGNAKSAFGLQDVDWPADKVERGKQLFIDKLSAASAEAGYWNDLVMLFVVARKPARPA